MIVFLDTDILIDIALDRIPFSGPAGRLLDFLQKKPGSSYVAWHSLSNFYYLVSPRAGAPDTRRFIEDLLRFVQVSPTVTKDALLALNLPMTDFEDALQSAAAAACKADIIATRNVRHYRRSPIPARSPATVLDLVTK